MSNINWDEPFSFEVPLPPPLPEITLSFPTYGLNGGAGFTGGAFVGEEDYLPPSSFNEPVGLDLVDLAFFEHDLGTELAAANPILQAQADYDLLQELVDFNRHDLADPEASLYAGVAELGMILSLAINPEGIDLTPKELAKDTRDAIQNIEYGLRHLEPEEFQDVQQWLSGVFTALDDFNLQPNAVLELAGLHHHTVDLLLA